jgi:hypothetical protein
MAYYDGMTNSQATYTFTPAGSGSIAFPSFESAMDYIHTTYPSAVVFGTSVNDGKREFGKFLWTCGSR